MGITAITFRLSAGFGDIINIGALVKGILSRWLGPIYVMDDVTTQELQQFIHNIVLDGHFQVIEHVESFVLELNERVSLSN